ncbi:MAG: glycoside hydrolase family 20 zincin-like fold domain-containing protein [Acidobacteriota bacterium]|nr:glycoside hydrolase family 20 zincin-like fold domain-containing protein [Acidobacteriota bacterium]
MKKREFPLFPILCLWAFLFIGAAVLTGAPASDPPAALKRWTDRIIPLPQRIETAGSIRISPRGISLSLPGGESPLLRTAGELLRPLAQGSGFEIKGALTGEDVPADLRGALLAAPNSDQAYAIRPILRKKRFRGLLLAANTPLGLLYAARTLRQLVPAGASPESTLEIPRVTILDWPDLAERGEWGGSATLDIPWLAERKLNTIEVHAQLGFNDDGSPKASLSPVLMEEAGRQGVTIVPIILHMEQLAGTGLFRHHPEVAAMPKPGQPLPTDYTPPVCFSHPKTAELLSGWMNQLLAVQGVEEVDVWLSEESNRCYCPLCAGEEPFVLETKGILRAFDATRRLRPEARLRILLTQASHDVNDQVLAVVGRNAKVIYYDGGRTYDSSHRPMIEPVLSDFAAAGGWMGVYPQLTNSWRTVFPWSGAEFMRARMNEFVGKGLRSFIGYATPHNSYYDFNVTAAAEWSWNSRGRTPRAFAEAYAVRRGIVRPAAFAAWSELVGPVGWKLAGSRTVERLVFGAGGLVFVDGRIVPGSLSQSLASMDFGGTLLGEFDNERDFEAGRERARQALTLARSIGDAAVLAETESVAGVLDLLENLREIAAADSLPDEAAKRDRLGRALDGLDGTARALAGSLGRWGRETNPVPRNRLASRFRDTVDFASHLADAERASHDSLGLPDPFPSFRSRLAARWRDEDFARSETADLWADVTAAVDGPGEYDVTFRFEDGASGVKTRAATLLRGPDRARAKPVAEDRWDFRIGRFDRYVDYWLTVPGAVAAGATGDRYFLKLEIVGPALDAPADRRTCRGLVTMRKSWRE